MNWRLWAAVGAVVLLAIGIDRAFAVNGLEGDSVFAGPLDVDENGELVERRVDLISAVFAFERSDDFGLDADSRTTGTLDGILDGDRTIRIVPGTPGTITCEEIDVPGRCVVLADLLGQAVVWFAIVPRAPNDTAILPPIEDLQDGYAIFDNGWQIRYAPVIEREGCDSEEVVSFSDFLRRFGPYSTSVVDLETQQVAAVNCPPEDFVIPTTTEVYDGGSLDAAIDLGPTTTIGIVTPDITAPDG